jgi:phosphoglycerate dehydrogenase-like enzyme
MPLIGEREGKGSGRERLFIFLDGLEFIEGTTAYERFMEPLLEFGSYRYYKNRPEENHLLMDRISKANAIFLDWSNLNPEVLEQCKELEIVSYIGVGAANFVDIPAATRLGIVVTNTPDYGNRSVAEHTLGLILSVARNIAAGDHDLRRGEWTSWDREGVQIFGRSIGLIGMGAVGREMARLCHTFGLRIFYFDVDRKPEMEDIATFLEMDDLLSSCDIVSLHVPLNPQTRDLIGEREIALMREGSILINASRGEVLDLHALALELREGRIKGAGLDNFPNEPQPDLSELIPLDNVVMTPHIAFNTREAKDRMSAIAVDNMVSFYRGTPQNVMNPEALSKPR